MRTSWHSDALHRLVSWLPPERLASWRPLDARPIAGRGVDIATGQVVFSEEDFASFGSPPFALTRTYCSGAAQRCGVLGPGWTLSIEQRVTHEPGGLLWRDGEGRELLFMHEGALRPGLTLTHPLDPARLVCLDRGVLRIIDGRGRRLELEARSPAGPALLSSIEHGPDSVVVTRDADARPVVVQAGARRLHLLYAHARLRAVRVELASGESLDFASYDYDRGGHLVRVRLPHGIARGYELAGGLLVTRILADGERVYFGYDGVGPDARCVRTWSASGCDDRRLSYRFGATTVRDSDGTARVFEHDLLYRPTSTPHGKLTYDPASFAPIALTARRGRTQVSADAAGRPLKITGPDGAAYELAYDEEGRVITARDATGKEVHLRYDGDRLIERRGDGPRTAVVIGESGGTEIVVGDEWLAIERDGAGRVAKIRLRQEQWSATYDALGRPATLDGPEGRRRFEHDALGRLVAMEVDGARAAFSRDAEGRLLRASLPSGEWVIERDPTGLPRMVTRPDFACELRFDRERRLTSVTDRRGRRWVFTRDRGGRVVEETDFDQRAYQYRYAGASRDVSTLTLPGGQRLGVYRDGGGRVVEARHGAALEERFTYDAAGRLIEAWRESVGVTLTRNRAGEVVSERQGDDEVGARHDACGRRALVVSSLGARITRSWGASGERLVEVIGSDGVRHEVRLDRGRLVSGALSVPRAPDGPPLRDSGEGEVERDSMGHLAAWTAPDGRRFAYRYGIDGLIESVALPSGDTLTYEYDAFGRRLSARSERWDGRWVWDGGVVLHELSSAAPPRLFVFDPSDGSPIGCVAAGAARWLGLYEDFVSLFDPARPDRPTTEYWPFRGDLYIDFLTGLWLGPGRAFHPRAAEPMGARTLVDELFGPAERQSFEYCPRVLTAIERASDATLARFLHRLTTPDWLELPRAPAPPWPEPIEPPSLLPRGVRV